MKSLVVSQVFKSISKIHMIPLLVEEKLVEFSALQQNIKDISKRILKYNL